MSNELFKVGEIAELRDIPFPMTRLNGEECEVLGALAMRTVRDFFGQPEELECYVVQVADGAIGAVVPSQLVKKKLPPESEASTRNSTVSWDDCAWKPAEELV